MAQAEPQSFFAEISAIDKNGIIQLKDGRTANLAGIILVANGRKHLQKLLPQSPVKIHILQKASAKFLPAQIEIELLPNFFLRHQLLQSGNALMFPFTTGAEDAKKLRASEIIARNKPTGIWRKKKYPALLTPADAAKNLGRYKIVRGKILKQETHKNITYLNFGKNWRDDFTVRAPEQKFNAIAKQNGWATNLQNKIIECRGVLHEFYGAAIDLNHPAQCVLTD